MRYFATFLLLIGSLFAAEDLENGATSVITYFVLVDQTTGDRDTGVTIANLELYYVEDQGAESADAFTGAHGAVTDAWDSGECIHVGHGLYRIDWPDAAFDGGVGKRVQLTVIDGDDGARTETIVYQLSPPGNTTLIEGSDATDAINAAADAAIETYELDHLISVAAAEDEPADNSIIARLVATEGDWSEFNDENHSLEAIRVRGDAAWITATGFAVSGEPLTAQETEDECVDALESFNLDHLVKLAVDTNYQTTVHADSVVGYMTTSSATADYVRTTDSLEDLRDRGDAAWVTATGFSTHDAAAVKTAIEAGGSHLALILADTGAYDTDAEYAAAIWNALTNAYGGAGTYAQAAEDTLADTGELQTNQGAWATATGFSTHDAAAVWAVTMENSKTYAQVMRVVAAVLSGKSSAAAGQMTFVGIDGTTDRLIVTVSSGARTSVDTWDGD